MIFKHYPKYFLKLKILAIAVLLVIISFGCYPISGYPHKTIKPKNRNRAYNHLKHKDKKKTRVYWQKNH